MNVKHVIQTKYFEYGITLLVMLLTLGICIMGRWITDYLEFSHEEWYEVIYTSEETAYFRRK